MRTQFCLFAALFAILLTVVPVKSWALTEYRLEHNACGFSFTLPAAPTVIQIWPGEEQYHARFLRGAPLQGRPDGIRALKIIYRENDSISGESMAVDAYCMEFSPDYAGDSFSPNEMLVLLKNAIDQHDNPRLKSSFANAHVDFIEQENGIQWMKLRALVEERREGSADVVAYGRDIFTFNNRALILFLQYSAENRRYQLAVHNMMTSFILAD
ncbi:MAG: hypothetical protein EA357_04670 [Micavibrio sp.]|nr:MAG: hypothetical protein EA357_04670 [Micavibrio sp.]